VWSDEESALRLGWRHADASCSLEVDLVTGRIVIDEGGRVPSIAQGLS
jgi:hypothetical protein